MNNFTVIALLLMSDLFLVASFHKKRSCSVQESLMGSVCNPFYEQDDNQLPLSIQQAHLQNIAMQARADLLAINAHYVSAQDKISKKIEIGNYCVDVLQQVSYCEEEKQALQKFKEDQITWQLQKKFVCCCLSDEHEKLVFSQQYASNALNEVDQKSIKVRKNIDQLKNKHESVLSNRRSNKSSFDKRSKSDSYAK